VIVAQDRFSSPPQRDWHWLFNGSNSLVFRAWEPGTSSYSAVIANAASSLLDGNWHHICVTWDGTTNADAIKMAFDGQVVKTATATATGIKNESPYLPSIGSYHSPGSQGYYFSGNMSNVQVWNKGITESQIEQLYNNGVPLESASVASANLKAWYKLDNTSNYINYPQNLTFTPDYWSIDPYNITPGATEALNFSGGYQNTTSSYEGIEFNDTPLTDNKFIMSCWYNSTKSTNDNSYIYHNYSGGTIAMQFSSNQINVYANPATVGSHMMRYYLPPTRTGWHHLVIYMNQGSGSTVNLDNTDNLKLYVDGSEISVGLVLGDVSAAPVRTEANRLGWTAGGNFEGFQWSNWALLVGDNAVLSAIPTLYNGGTPGDISSLNPTWWYKLNSSDVSFPTSTPPTNPENVFTVTDSSGNGNTTTGPFYYAKSLTTPSQVPSIQTVNVVSNQGISSGMTEQNLVNNNVSAFNGESSGMNTTNLVTSNLTRTQPYSNYSFNFDAAQSDYFDCGDSDIFSFGNGSSDFPFTISAWAYIEGSSSFPIFDKYPDSGSWSEREYRMLEVNSSNQVFCTLYDSSATARFDIYSNSTITRNQWEHLSITYDGRGGSNASDGVKIYINGVESNKTVNAFGTYVAMENKSTPVRIGRLASNYADGKISNISLFDNELTQDDIINLYNNGIPQDLSNFRITPIAWWPMDEHSSYYDGTDWVVRDLINGNDGDGANTGNVDDLVGNAPGSEASGTGTNLTIADLKGDMKDSKNNAYSINMADYADGVTNPANSGRSTDTP